MQGRPRCVQHSQHCGPAAFPEFAEGDALLGRSGFAVDHVICPEESVTRYIHKLIEYPEALQVLEFADGRVSLIAVRAVQGSPLVGAHRGRYPRPFSACRDAGRGAVPSGCRSQRHQDRPHPGGRRGVCAGDTRTTIRLVLAAIHKRDKPVQSLMIAGGGKVGLRLARSLAGMPRQSD